MQMKHVFRCLLILTIVSEIASACFYLSEKQNLPLELRTYLAFKSNQFLSLHYTALTIQSVAVLALSVFSFLGLYFFWPSARILYCIFVAISLLANPFLGPFVEPGWTAFFDDCYKILLGVNFCMIFSPPIREQFSKSGDEPTK